MRILTQPPARRRVRASVFRFPRALPLLPILCALLLLLFANRTERAGGDAANDIFIQSSADTHSLRSENNNSSWAVGVAFGVGKNSAGFSVFAEGALGQGHENADGATHTNSHINATENLGVTSGRDTTISGATLAGDSVVMDIGRDLTLQSRQNTNTYESEQTQISAKGEGGTGGGGGSLSYSHSETEAGYASVKEQTGIFAGKGGFDINVGNHTSLTGAVIASEADPALNRMSTQTISFADIENFSKYDSKNISISVSAGSGGGSVSGGMSHQSDNKTGVTKSAIADGNITVRSDYDADGNRIADSLAGLSRDTARANDGAVGNIFDPQKLAEKQELAQVAGQVGFRVAGDIGKHYSKDAETKKAAADEYKKLADGTDDPALKAQYQAEADRLHAEAAPTLAIWGEGGAGKIALHAAVGAAQASLGGGDALAGALGAGAAEAARGIDLPRIHSGNEKLDNALNQTLNTIVSTGVGATAGGLAGDAMTGAGAAWDAEKYNRQLHPEELARLKELAGKHAAANGLTEAEAYGRLLAVAMAMVETGAESGNTAQLERNAGVLADAAAGGDYAWAYNVLAGAKSAARQTWADGALLASLRDGSPKNNFSFQHELDNALGLDRVDQGAPHYFLEHGAGWKYSDTLAALRAGNAEAQSDFYHRAGIEAGAEAVRDAAWAVGTTPVRWGSGLGELGGHIIGNEIAIKEALLSGNTGLFEATSGVVRQDYKDGVLRVGAAINTVGTALGEESVNIAYDPSRAITFAGKAYDYWLENPGRANATLTDSAFAIVGTAELGSSLYKGYEAAQTQSRVLANINETRQATQNIAKGLATMDARAEAAAGNAINANTNAVKNISKATSAVDNTIANGAKNTSNVATDTATGLPRVATSEDIKVIGRLPDTAVAQEWSGHDVLNIPDWTLQKNMQWVDQGITNKQTFYLGSPTQGNMVQTTGPYAGQLTVTALEIQRLENAGYVKIGDYYVHPSKAANFVPPKTGK